MKHHLIHYRDMAGASCCQYIFESLKDARTYLENLGYTNIEGRNTYYYLPSSNDENPTAEIIAVETFNKDLQPTTKPRIFSENPTITEYTHELINKQSTFD